MVELMVHAIGTRPIVVERRKHFPYRMNDAVQALDIEERLLLTREGGFDGIFGGRRRAHRKRRVGALPFELRVSGADGVDQSGRKRSVRYPPPYFAPRFGELSHVVDVELRQACRDLVAKVVLGQELPKRL